LGTAVEALYSDQHGGKDELQQWIQRTIERYNVDRKLAIEAKIQKKKAEKALREEDKKKEDQEGNEEQKKSEIEEGMNKNADDFDNAGDRDAQGKDEGNG